MLRIEIQPTMTTDEFDVIVELDRTSDDGFGEDAREMSCGFTVVAKGYDNAVLAAFPRIQQVLEIFKPKTPVEETADEMLEAEEKILLKILQDVFGEDNVQCRKVTEKEETSKPDFSAHDLFDNVWDEINKNYSLGDK